MNLDAYDDMMGLEFGDYESSMDGLLDPQMLKEALIASLAGGGAILAAAWGTKKLAAQPFMANITNPLLKAGLTAGATFAAGVVGGRYLYGYNREAAIGVMGGLGGIAMAHFLDVAISQMTGQPVMGVALGDGDNYSDMDGMAALASLETTGVTSAPGAFQGFADPSVTPEALMGLESAVVQQESLGGMEGYNGYLA